MSSVRSVWVKKLVPTREYGTDYAKIPHYYLLGGDDKHKLVAFTYIPSTDPMPHHLEECNEHESKKLNKWYYQ